MRYAPAKKNKRMKDVVDDLSKIKTLPRNGQVLGRLKSLQQLHNGKHINIVTVMLSKEIRECWQNQDMPVQPYKTINMKIKRLRLKKTINEMELFDVLPLKSKFKSNEEKKYYECQKKGVGYCSTKEVSYQCHPSRIERKPADGLLTNELNLQDDNNDSSVSNEMDNIADVHLSKESASTELAAKVRQAANLSLSQTIKVFDKLYEELGDETFRSPTRGALQKACLKLIGRDVQSEYTYTDNILRFDSKTYPYLYGNKRHILVICYDNKLLALREIADKKAQTISNLIVSVLKDKNLIPKYCVCDTEPTNSGRLNGVVALLKKQFSDIVYEPCRLHILDLILKHEMQVYFPETSCGPNLPLPFVLELEKKWQYFKVKYNEITNASVPRNYCEDLPSVDQRRRDYRLLLELVLALKYRRESGYNPKINLPNYPPSISQARWNSRAIYCIFAELVLEADEKVANTNTFIVDVWAKAWFSVRNFINWQEILESNICPKSKRAILRNISNFLDDKPLTNEIAERVFRMVTEKIAHCKSIVRLEEVMISYCNEDSNKLN